MISNKPATIIRYRETVVRCAPPLSDQLDRHERDTTL